MILSDPLEDSVQDPPNMVSMTQQNMVLKTYKKVVQEKTQYKMVKRPSEGYVKGPHQMIFSAPTKMALNLF